MSGPGEVFQAYVGGIDGINEIGNGENFLGSTVHANTHDPK